MVCPVGVGCHCTLDASDPGQLAWAILCLFVCCATGGLAAEHGFATSGTLDCSGMWVVDHSTGMSAGPLLSCAAAVTSCMHMYSLPYTLCALKHR